jgi:hypothetical protein
LALYCTVLYCIPGCSTGEGSRILRNALLVLCQLGILECCRRVSFVLKKDKEFSAMMKARSDAVAANSRVKDQSKKLVHTDLVPELLLTSLLLTPPRCYYCQKADEKPITPGVLILLLI